MRNALKMMAFALALMIAPGTAWAANCAANPNTLINGSLADATQVMANFNNLLSCANNNLAHNGANSDITSLSALSTPLSVAQGGTGGTTATGTGAVVLQNGPTLTGNNVFGNVTAISGFPLAAGFPGTQAVRLAANTALPANVYANGASGVGATLTSNANGALSIDGVTVQAGWRVGIWGEAAAANNGEYTVTTVGDAGTKYVLTRATDFDSAAHMTTRMVPVQGTGSTLNYTLWTFTNPGGIVVGTTAINFTQYTAASPFYVNSSNQLAMLGFDVGYNGSSVQGVATVRSSGRFDVVAAPGDYGLVISGAVASPSRGLKVAAGSGNGQSNFNASFFLQGEVNNALTIWGDGGATFGDTVANILAATSPGWGNVQIINASLLPVWNQNAESAWATGTNNSSGTSARGAFVASNATDTSKFGVVGTAYTALTGSFAAHWGFWQTSSGMTLASGSAISISTGGATTEVGRISTTGGWTFPQVSTTASAANAFLDNGNSNNLLRSTSSVRYKAGVTYFGVTAPSIAAALGAASPLRAPTPDSGALIDALKPILYQSKAAADDPSVLHYGQLAEDVAQADPRLVTWIPLSQVDTNGDAPEGYGSWRQYFDANAVNGMVPDSVQYEREIVPLIAEVQSLRARLKAAGIP